MKGSMTTNRLVLIPSEHRGPPAGSAGLVQQEATAPSATIQFGEEPLCVKIEGRRDDNLIISSGQGQSLAEFKTASDGTTTLFVENLAVRQRLDLAEGDFLIGGIKQWRLVHTESFTLGQIPDGWDITQDVVTSCAGVVMLGGYGKFAKGEVSKTFASLPPHSFLRIAATFHFIDNWTGDSGFMRVDAGKDGSLIHVWIDSHKVESGRGVNLCGKNSVPETKFAVPIDITIPHKTTAAKIAFGSTLQTNIPEEVSWGLSSLELYVR